MPEHSYIFKIQRYSIHDGPGIRTTLFLRGCPLSCSWCHNPESQPMPDQTISQIQKGVISRLMDVIETDRLFFEESGGGVTFSGGEPLCQPELLSALLDECRSKQIHTCLDTSGFAPVNILEQAAQKADMILYDVKFIDEDAHAKNTGKGASLILNNLRHLSGLDINVKIRFPFIPGITDTDNNIDDIVTFLTRHTIYRDIHLLPYHSTAQNKYEKLNRKYCLSHLLPPSEERLTEVKTVFESSGFKVTFGG